MYYKKLGECAKITFCSITPSRSKTQTASSKWFACSNFLVDNVVVNEPIVNNIVPDNDWLLHQHDIVIKRITPTFVNYIDFDPQEIYGGTHALAVSLAGKVRVNSISLGWIDTSYKVYEGPDAYQQPCGRVGNPLDIANMVLFLCSDKAGFITGENICIDGGMTKQMIYHGDNGWELK